jgi:Fe-S oxidoreductase
MYLLEMPKRPSRRKKFEKSNEKFMKRFKQVGADIDSIVDENTSCLMHFRDELNKLKENKE